VSLAVILLTILGLILFEVVSGIDNAIINAEVLSTMGKKYRRWFAVWGLLLAVFVIRGLLPWIIIWFTTPSLGPIGALTATFSSDESVKEKIEQSVPMLLAFGGTFLLFLFFDWLYLEPKKFGLKIEKMFLSHGVWFYAIVSILLVVLVKLFLNIDPTLAFAAVLGSAAFFITNGFRRNAETNETDLIRKGMKDVSKILYLIVIDFTFSTDAVLGAFAFTVSVPLILIGNGIGAIVIRQITLGSIDKIKKYVFIKNGAMYSILFLGMAMILDAFGFNIPSWASPVITFLVVAFFFLKSGLHLVRREAREFENELHKISS